MSPTRAAEILATFGADAARWPDTERADCLALIERLPNLGYDRRRAAVLDVWLVAWAREPIEIDDGATDRAVARAMAALPARGRPLAWVGGALAASVAAGLAFVTLRSAPPAHFIAPTQISQAQTDSAQFRAVFTPTPDEEDVLS